MDWAGLPGEIAVGRREEEGPVPVGTATHDIGWLGCRDMAGNGRSGRVTESGENHSVLPRRSPPGRLRPALDAMQPLKSADIENHDCGSLIAIAGIAGVSFRVVLDNL